MVFEAGTIRVKAMAVIWRRRAGHAPQLLLEQIQDLDGQIIGHRLLGGGIEFGEKSWETVEREFMEELGEDVKVVRLIENIFTWSGRPGHEITFVYEAELLNKAAYAEDIIERIDTSSYALQVKTAQWLDPFELPDGLPLFPEGLQEKLRANS